MTMTDAELRFAFEGRRVFLSGPMTGIEDFNRAAFDEAEAKLLGAGAEAVFSPATLAPARGQRPDSHDAYMLRTLHHLTRMRTNARGRRTPMFDAVAMLPGWDCSKGAATERRVAEACGIPLWEVRWL